MPLSHHPGRIAPQAAPLRNLRVQRLARLPRASRGLGRGVDACPELLGALDSSSIGLALNLQSEVRRLSRPEIPTRSGLSTFNRVSFLSSHLSLSQCSSKSFTIRTSKTPLPQLLYNPHLQAPLGSAGNKGLITLLESALTKNSPVSLLESALTKKWGWGERSLRPTREGALSEGHYSNKSGCSREMRSQSGWNWNQPARGEPSSA